MIERYTLEEMKKIWSVEHKYRAWLLVEKAVVYAWSENGVIPKEALYAMEALQSIDVDAISQIEQETKHDVIAFITYLERSLGEYGRFIHFGCTSSDIIDTANALLLKEAGEMLLGKIEQLLSALAIFIGQNKGRVTIGRTHGVHAEPTTYALKFASFYAELKRDYERFVRAVNNISFGKISGAVGTYAFLSPEIEEIACEYLGLMPDTISSQIIQRDRYAEYCTTIAIMAGSIERLCVELRHLQRTEVGEIEENFVYGQKGSSAMPHKKNPISAENITGLCRILRSNAFASLENMVLWHERDISHSSAERIILPDNTIVLDYIVTRMTKVIENLRVKSTSVERAMRSSFGLFFSQRILTAMIEKGMQRQEAYTIVQRYAMQAYENEEYFPSVLQQAPEIVEYFSIKELEELFDIGFYIRHEKAILERVGL